MRQHLVVLGLAAAALAAFAGQAKASVLFYDSFYANPPVNDINFGIGAPRQSGSVVGAGISYLKYGATDSNYVQVGNGGAKLLLATDTVSLDPNNNSYNRVSPNYNFNAPPVGTTDLEMSATFYPAAGADWMAFGVGGSYEMSTLAGAQGTFVNATNGLAMLITSTGVWQTFDALTQVGADTTTAAASYNFKWVLHNPVFDGLTPTAVSLYLNGTQVDANGAAAGMDISRVLTNNQILLATRQGPVAGTAASYVSDLTVNAVVPEVPEPASLGLLSLAGMVMLRRRRA